jgi:8-oxo-dGTP diphosphatase
LRLVSAERYFDSKNASPAQNIGEIPKQPVYIVVVRNLPRRIIVKSTWKMAKSSKLVARKRGRILLVRRRRDRLWMFPGGQRRARESEKDCLRREIKEELPNLKLGRIKLWKEVKAKNRHSGRKMNDAIFIAGKVSGDLAIGDKHEIDKATWRKPRGVRLTPTSRYVRDMLFPKR